MVSVIAYVCLSDLHAGAPAGLFSPRDGLPDVAGALARALGALLSDGRGEPRLVLLGDTMDLQFSEWGTAAGEAARILAALRDAAAWRGDILATAGNHDHALWTDARHGLEVEPKARLQTHPVHGTPAFDARGAGRARLLDRAAREAGFAGAELRYPNVGLRAGGRAVLLHHGHFHEAAYRAVTRLRDVLAEGPRPPPTAATLAAENAGWIDFAWSGLGDAAGLGREAEDLYQRLLTPTGFRRALTRWSDIATDAIADRVPGGALPEPRAAIGAATRAILGATLGRMREDERHHEVDALPPDGRRGLTWYLGAPVAAQVAEELDAPPAALTYVCGHTHKPYAERIAAPGLPVPVEVLNSGGWTLNGPRLDNAEGAGVVLIDDAMNAVLLRAVGTPRNGVAPEPRVEGFGSGDGGAFRRDVEARLEGSRAAWTALSEAAAAHYAAIQADLLGRTDA
ncbi:hypothetical protein JQC91_08500 [Jannaschia sp. Os4]|uniref:hypothetical protein n=1 Tax=Jannaschia sp. Os4 TaxID=2807617 RepID=UPI0019397A81|nr:hypothetical protein [Jannaschia sp. Os4]MBM2576345.1 hypothetical protein [Jannaschia sp. Os4]